MVNTAFALKFITPCKQASKCDIYHLCFWFTPSLHFFASYLHRVNLCKSNFSCSVGLTHHWLGADMDKWNVKELSVCLRGWNRFDRFFFTCRRRGRMSSPQARPKLSGKHGFQTRGGWGRARGASGGWWERAQCASREWWVGKIPVLPSSPLSQLGNVTQKWIRAISNFIAIIPPGLIFQLLANFAGIEFLKTLLIQV